MSFATTHGKMPKKKFKKIPERWEDYTNIGARVEGTKFVAFKVPLHFHEDWNLEELKKAVPDLKHIIDLTNTNRYYSPSQCDKQGWKHKKIFVPGGGMVPAKQNVEQFYAAVSEAMSEDGLIGVHCTHGLNRTGYMVCRYMIEKNGIDPDQAILAFDTARGHKQERENYLDHLKTKAWETETPSSSRSSPSQPFPRPSQAEAGRQHGQTRHYHSGANKDNQWRQPYNRCNSHYDDNWRQPHDRRRHHDYNGDYREYKSRGPHQNGRYNRYDDGYHHHDQYNQGYNRYPDDRSWYSYGNNYRGNQSRRGDRKKDYYETRAFTPSHHSRHRGSTSSNSDSQSKSSE